MSTAIAKILGQYPRHKEVVGRLVLNMTGEIQSMVSGHKSEEHIENERALIVQTLRQYGSATLDMLADETGIVHEHVSARLRALNRIRTDIECTIANNSGMAKGSAPKPEDAA